MNILKAYLLERVYGDVNPETGKLRQRSTEEKKSVATNTRLRTILSRRHEKKYKNYADNLKK